jgi:tetratricopeptide (TPR) repeat protein
VAAVPDVASHQLYEPREIAFDLDRLELVGGRLELAGRWFGVQGRRFMRPSLTLRDDDGETRLLADLAHKPWAAENGELWRAAFRCDGEVASAEDAELTVAPDLTVELAVPDAVRRSRRSDAQPASDAGTAKTERGAQRSTPEPTISQARPPVIEDRRQDAAQTQALIAARAELATLRERLEELDAAFEQERAQFARELRDAQQTTGEALAARGKAKQAAGRALAERDEALARLDKALAQRNEVLAHRDRALAQRDEALAQRDQAATKRSQAVKALKRVGAEREELAPANEELGHQAKSTVATRGRPVMRDAAIEPTGERRAAHRVEVAIAVTSLLAVALALILILSSH